MTSFFPMSNGPLRPTASSPPTSLRDHDPFTPLNRTPSNQVQASQRAQPRMTNPSRTRNGYGANGDSAVPIPQNASGQFGGGGGAGGAGLDRNGGPLAGPPPFDMARSPPNPANKNTKHVPCKFFRQGTCQAGNACPFSHAIDPLTQQAPCKYFMKGNCKFGAKCALAHFLPDGRRVNRSDIDYGMNMNGRPFNIGGRVEPPMYHNQDSVLANSLLTQQQFPPPELFPTQYQFTDQNDPEAFHDRYNQFNQPYHIPSIETGLNSPPGSHFGSPPDDSLMPRSPVENIRTALNAPLPQSFDPNGLSHIARYGPLGQSVPDKFGLKSPAGSLPRKAHNPQDTLPTLRTGAKVASPLGSSPQTQDDSYGQRVMHSQRLAKPRVLSASVPKSGLLDDWEENFNMDADMLPNSLHDEVLTPSEKIRRLSRPEQDFTGSREQANALAIPSGTSSKVGSPSAAGSPSRFRALWEEQREKKGTDTTPNTNTNTNTANAFGHVGSPLRESWMPNYSSNSPQNASLSGISQQIARMNIHRTESSESNGSRAQPSGLRHSSAPVGRFERAIASPKISSKRIDEEVEGVFFPMDDENSKRSSSNWEGKDLDSIKDPLENGSGNGNGSGGGGVGGGGGGGVRGGGSSRERQESGNGSNNSHHTNGTKPIFGFRP